MPPIDIRLQNPLPAAAVLSSCPSCTSYTFITLIPHLVLSLAALPPTEQPFLRSGLGKVASNLLHWECPQPKEASSEDRRQPYSGRCRLPEGGGRQNVAA